MNVTHTALHFCLIFFLIVFMSLNHSHNQPISIFLLEQPHILLEFSLFSPFYLVCVLVAFSISLKISFHFQLVHQTRIHFYIAYQYTRPRHVIKKTPLFISCRFRFFKYIACHKLLHSFFIYT